GERTAIFLAGGGTRLADELGVPLLGEVPLQAQLADLADTGRPIVAAQPDLPAARARDAIARRLADALATVARWPAPPASRAVALARSPPRRPARAARRPRHPASRGL